VRGTWREGPFTRDPEGYVKGGSGNRHLSPLGPCWGTWRGDHLLGILRDGQRQAREICKRRLWQKATLSVWGPLENLEGGFIYQGLCDTVIFGLLFLDPENVRSLSLRAYLNFSKGPGLPVTWHKSLGHKGLV
jgi:hypothetical protein